MWVMAGAMEGAAGIRRGAARFAAYLDEIAAVLGHARRGAAARAYCTGLLLPGARKSVEPMAPGSSLGACKRGTSRCTMW